jgi:type VI secretion system protein ImpF
MPSFRNETQSRPSLLDRLLEDESPESPATTLSKTSNKLIDAIRRDLEALLNTRQANIAAIPSELEEASRSLLVYGLPDLSAFNFRSEHDQTRLAQLLKNAIATFEPRLQQVRVTPQPLDELKPALRFAIEGVLKIFPEGEHIIFETAIEPETGKCRIEAE